MQSKEIDIVQMNKRARSRKKWESYKLFLLVLPCIALVTLFHYVPLWGWSYAFFQYKPGRSLANSQFVGWSNFTSLFSNAVLRTRLARVMYNTVGMQLIGYCFSPLPMFFAIFLSEIRTKKFVKAVQTVTTLPHFISWVIMFSLVFCMVSSTGVINSLLVRMGVVDEPIRFLTDVDHAWLYMILLGEWKGLGWSSIVYFASISGIDQELYEAAQVDGASRMQRIWHITVPSLIGTFFVLLVMSIGNFLNSGIDKYLVFSNALNKDAIEVLDLYVYNLGLGSGQISFSVAVGIMKSFIALILFGGANIASKKIRGTSVF